jgi:hypothetical protein
METNLLSFEIIDLSDLTEIFAESTGGTTKPKCGNAGCGDSGGNCSCGNIVK